jgi:hypothetical protein
LSCVAFTDCTTDTANIFCVVGSVTLQVGQNISFPAPSCQIAVCTVVQSSTGVNSGVVAQLNWYTNTSCKGENVTCTDPSTGEIYPVGTTIYPSNCKACTCKAYGWSCTPIDRPSCNGTNPDAPQCTSDGQSYPLGTVITFSDCLVCECKKNDTVNSAYVSGAALFCNKTCNDSTSTIRFCYDRAGSAYGVGATISTLDGCSTCTCTYPTGAEKPTWNCTIGTGNNGCCQRDGVSYQAGSVYTDRKNCEKCTCNDDGTFTCVTLAGCVQCTFDNKTYLAGEQRQSSCGLCTCQDDATWLCDKDCTRECIRIKFNVTFTGNESNIDFTAITDRIDAIFGEDNWEISNVNWGPGYINFIFVVICYNSTAANATTAGDDAGRAVSDGFVGDGINVTVENSIEDEGTVIDTGSSASSTETTDSSPTNVSDDAYTIAFSAVALVAGLIVAF